MRAEENFKLKNESSWHIGLQQPTYSFHLLLALELSLGHVRHFAGALCIASDACRRCCH